MDVNLEVMLYFMVLENKICGLSHFVFTFVG